MFAFCCQDGGGQPGRQDDVEKERPPVQLVDDHLEEQVHRDDHDGMHASATEQFAGRGKNGRSAFTPGEIKEKQLWVAAMWKLAHLPLRQSAKDLSTVTDAERLCKLDAAQLGLLSGWFSAFFHRYYVSRRQGEEQILFPHIASLVVDFDVKEGAHLLEQQKALDALVEEIKAALQALAAAGKIDSKDTNLHDLCLRLDFEMSVHLEDKEASLIPLMQRYVGQEELKAVDAKLLAAPCAGIWVQAIGEPWSRALLEDNSPLRETLKREEATSPFSALYHLFWEDEYQKNNKLVMERLLAGQKFESDFRITAPEDAFCTTAELLARYGKVDASLKALPDDVVREKLKAADVKGDGKIMHRELCKVVLAHFKLTSSNL